jgi:hypothetical protein
MQAKFYGLTLGILSVWRVTHLLNAEDGPWDLVVRLRRRAGAGFWAGLLDCFNCLSLWIAAPVTFFVSHGPAEWLFTWLALSGGACLLERMVRQPAIFQTLPPAAETEGDDHVLRSETLEASDHSGAEGPSKRAH